VIIRSLDKRREKGGSKGKAQNEKNSPLENGNPVHCKKRRRSIRRKVIAEKREEDQRRGKSGSGQLARGRKKEAPLRERMERDEVGGVCKARPRESKKRTKPRKGELLPNLSIP